jgi:predicted ATP-dependent endonuclease of OLD family
MKLNDKIIIKNYKCFDTSGGGFEKLLPINIIIGKNNSGKSSLIDLIRFIVEKEYRFIEGGRDKIKPEVLVDHSLTERDISIVFDKRTRSFGVPDNDNFTYGKRLIGEYYTYRIDGNGKTKFVGFNTDIVPSTKELIVYLAEIIIPPLYKKKFCNISAERDILPEEADPEVVIMSNGSGATNVIQNIINKANVDSQLIEEELLRELNTIVKPDIEFTRILVQLRENNKWEVYFEDSNNKRIALSKMGSGIKTVLLVLLNLYVRPVIESRKKNSYVFAFEELENNLHPSLQRRLYSYISNYSKKHSSYFFLTTHSNVVIDTFSSDENSQLIHVENDGDKSTTRTILSYNGTKQILNDLGIKASDILQSNGVIWVEGPSDRNYINRWIEILAPDLQEGLHYSIMFYGGRLLANLSFDFGWFNNEVIPLLKINRNAFVVLDRDGKTMKTVINETKRRITEEIGENNSWITKGREIENYLTDKTISDWLFNVHGIKTEFYNDKNTKLEENIQNSGKKINLKYNGSKTVFSSEIVNYIDKDSLSILDLNENLSNLIQKIRNWNK